MCCSSREESFTYSVPVSVKQLNETAVYRNCKSFDNLVEYYDENIRTMQDVYLCSYKKFSNKQCLGSRNKNNANQYEFKSYKEVQNKYINK